jgi:hypothetical protein
MLSLFDFFTLSLILISVVSFLIYLSISRDQIKRYRSKIEKLEEKLSTKHTLDTDTVSQIFGDLKTRGCSVVRIDSNDIFYRSPKG